MQIHLHTVNEFALKDLQLHLLLIHLSKIRISSPRDNVKTAVNTTITAPNAVTKKHMYYIRTPPKKEKHQGAQRQSQHTRELWAPMSCWPVPAPVAGRDGAVVRSAAHLQRKFLS